jgi:hypothetical protein
MNSNSCLFVFNQLIFRRIEVILNANASVSMSFVSNGDVYTDTYTFVGNFSDGYRHFVQMNFNEINPIVQVIV